MNDRELLQPVVPRHRFSMVIVHADDGYEDLRIDLDDRAELKYGVNKAAVIGDDHNMRGFVRLVSELEEGETKTFAWVTAHGIKEWTLSRGPSALYVNVPEFGEWFSIPYEPFRDECRAAYERYYGWGYEAENIRLSQLKDTWEECGFRYNVSMDPDDWHDAVYRRYGDLPDGRIWVWREDKRDKRFWPDDGDDLTDRIEGLPVRDAVMRTDGILVLILDGSCRSYGYLCDEDILLVRYDDFWIPASKAESPFRNDLFSSRIEYWPDSFAFMIRSEDDEDDYYSCGVRRVCFEPGLEVIKPGILADNPDLESVTIPASVKEVRTWAFGSCTNLKNLVIEGDLSRVADWAPDAFEGCACEEEYLRLRDRNT